MFHGEAKMTTRIETHRLRWLGHTKILNKGKMTKEVLNRTLIGKRRIGQPRRKEFKGVM